MKSGKMVNARKGLQPLEFEECIIDSPEFRENLNRHEKELDHTSQQIKRIIKEVRELVTAAKFLTQKQRTLAASLNDFNFECIGSAQTDDEQVISASLRHFGKLIENIEEEREKMLKLAHEQIIDQLEDFRKKQIGAVKENKKKFDKKTEKFCQSQERVLNMSTKKPGNAIQEAEASLGMHKREYIQESLSYVLRIQEIQERIKFEFVEILLAFINGWLVFYHAAHEQGEDEKEYLTDLRHKVQKTRENFNETREKVTELKSKYMEKKTKPEEKYSKRGYLFLMEKKPFKATWSKYYCTYKKQPKEFTMLQFNQIAGRPESPMENLTLISCTRRSAEFEKRFCFDLQFKEKSGATYTFQALSDEDYKGWINIMDGTEPTNFIPGKSKLTDEYQLDDVGFLFVKKCIEVLESRGLEDEGIYRKSGVGTKITKLLSLGMDRKKIDALFTDEQYQDLLESNTIASALKTYLRNLNEPLMTYQYHSRFIAAAKQEGRAKRINDIHSLVHCLPRANFDMLEMVIRHLTEVTKRYDKNKMSVFNLGVVFGPTLLRSMEETVAAILDIKFNNIVIHILIDNYDLIFKTKPGIHSSSSLDPTSSRLHAVQKSSRLASAVGGQYNITDSIVMHNPQPPPIRPLTTNYSDQSVSSSLQSIPNGIMYHPSGKCISSSSGSTELNVLNPTKHHHKMSHLTLSDSDIRGKNETITNQLLLNPHNPMSTAKSKEYMLHIGGSGHSNNTYPSCKDDLVHTNAGSSLSPRSITTIQQSEVSQYQTSTTHTRHSLYPGTKHCSSSSSGGNTLRDNKDQINSTSSSNESVCDSVLSSRDNMKRNISGSNAYGRLHMNRSFDLSSSAPTTTDEAIGDSYTSKYLSKKLENDLALGTARVRTLYACLGENEGELSFEPNQIITNVRFSHEPGWLQGTLNGKTGLIPENYVERLTSQH